MTFEPTLESIRRHTAPRWYNDAKLGIFVHWGIYSVPGWAPTTGPLPEVIAASGWQGWFSRNPYSEWYMNSIRVPGSPSAEYHAASYGVDFTYEQLVPQFNSGLAGWNPGEWADLFAAAGAQYVVLTTKHHDGFMLWPSAHSNPTRPGYQVERDITGELTEAVRARGMRMGLYYSGGLDWTFNDHLILDIMDLVRAIPQSSEYIAYAGAHIRELIDRYAPAVLWNDIGYPAAANLPELFAYYYNQVPEGVINDRFTQMTLPNPSNPAPEGTPGGWPRPVHYDFSTHEYSTLKEIATEKWEACRGLGYSFGYNRNERVSDMLSADALIRSFVDTVSKNGNLLINVGPMGDGTIPAEQRESLLALGRWMQINGQAINATRPWQRAEGSTADGTAVRFTQSQDAFYAILLGAPASQQIVIEDLDLPQGADVTLLGHAGALPATHEQGCLVVTLPSNLPDGPAVYSLRIGA